MGYGQRMGVGVRSLLPVAGAALVALSLAWLWPEAAGTARGATNARASIGGAPRLAWTSSRLPARASSIVGLSCPSVRLCVAVDDAGDVITSTRPASQRPGWSLAHVASSAFRFLSCPSARLCVALDQDGDVASSTNPGAVRSWHVFHLFTPNAYPSGETDGELTCPSVHLCVGLAGGTGDILESTDPASTVWRIVHVDTSQVSCGGSPPLGPSTCAGQLEDISCPSTSMCVGVDSNGFAVVSSDPIGGASAWQTFPIDGEGNGYEAYNPIVEAACPSPSRCIAADFTGNILASSNPVGGSGAWTRTMIETSYGFLVDLSCPSVSLCIGIEAGNNSQGDDLLTSRNPTGPSSAWRKFPARISGASTVQTNLTCTPRLCLEFNLHGAVAASTAPATGPRAWTSARISRQPILAVACPTSSICVAADQADRIKTIHITPPIGSSPTSR
jgi:hypothetical protein